MTTVTHEVRPTAPNGYLTLGLLITGVLVSLILTWLVAPRWQLRRHEDEDEREQADDHPHRARHRAQRSGLFASVPLPALRGLGYLARLTSLGAATVSAALLIGIAANMVGGFYTSWSSIAQSFMDGLH